VRHRLPLIGALVLLAAVGFSFFAFSGSGTPKSPARPNPTAATPGGKVIPVAQRVPPQPGKSWRNTLDVPYVPVGDIHFATIETRVKDFTAFVEARNYDAEGGMYSLQKEGFKQHGYSWRNPGFPQTPEHPVVGISYEDAKYFCDWLTTKERSEGALTAAQFYRLPTDREWSEAAGVLNESGSTPEERSGKVKVYAWGAGPLRADTANYAGSEAASNAPSGWPVISGYRDSFPRTAPVTSFAANSKGIYNLGGNVWEWCQDRFNATNNWCVIRGGAWSTSRPQELSLSSRRGYDPTFRHDDVGFRCVIATDAGER
jgi:formylglycine-generating enzyme required for sulfatase activity